MIVSSACRQIADVGGEPRRPTRPAAGWRLGGKLDASSPDGHPPSAELHPLAFG